MILRPRYLEQLKDYMWDGQIKIITGIRRCGKSVLLFELFYNYLLDTGVQPKNIIRLELDKRRDAKYRNPVQLAGYIETILNGSTEKYYLFIDEIQFCYEVPDADNPGHSITVYDMLNELKGWSNLDVYVTGSNSKMLSHDIATEFRGRASQIQVWPLSFSEYHNYIGGDRRDNFDTYMVYGGMPYLFNLKNERQQADYLKRLFAEVYIKDIVERKHIRHRDLLEDILNLLSSSVGSLTNPANITNTLRSIRKTAVNASTASDYLRHIQEAFLVTEAKRYDIKGKRYMDTPCKYYYTDLGLRNARLNFRQIDPGHIMENIIFNELLAREYSVDVGIVTDRRHGQNAQKEIDFIVNRGDKRVYIQSAYEINSSEKENTELDSLKLTKDFFGKIIIQRDLPRAYTDENGILHCSVTEFLLNEDICNL